MASTSNDPLQILPYEIWVKCMHIYARDQPEGALPLLSISSAWQHSLLVAPKIWDTVYFDGGNDEEARAECFFHLSQSSLVDLVLDRNSGGMDIAIKYGDKIRSLTFRTKHAKSYSSADIRRFSYKLSIRTYPNLVRIHVEPPCYVYDLIPLNLIRACPSLVSIQWAYLDQTIIPSDMVFQPGVVLAKVVTSLYEPSAAYTLQANPILNAAFGTAKGVFEILKEENKKDGIVSDLADGIERILPLAALVLEEIVCDEAELLQAAVIKMCALVADTANFIYVNAKELPRFSTLMTLFEDIHVKIKTLQDDFIGLDKDFGRAVDATSMRKLRKYEEQLLFDRLKPAEGADYQQDGSCMEGTRTAVLDDIIAWALGRDKPPDNTNAGNIYWLYGSPGCGKTSVANSLCERLHRNRNLGGSFFCKRDDLILHQPKRVLPTLISKLAGMWSPYRKLVAQALQDDPQLNPDSAGGEILLKLLKSVQKHPPSTFVLVIDALDECGEPDTRKPLLKSLLEACFQVSWLKVIVTSRQDHDIERFFKKHLVTSWNLATDDPNIALLTKEAMALVAKRRNLIDWPSEEQLKQIIERSGGLFIFVETLRRFVDQLDPEPLLAQVLDGDLNEANVQLYTLYSTTIATSIGPHVDAFRSVAQAIVVVAQYRPLCDDALASLLRLKPAVVKTMIDVLSPLLYRHRDGNGIRVRHLSIIEFLTGPACPPEFRVDLQQANAELSVHCIATMTRELKFNICDLETSLLANAEIQGLDKLVESRIPDALQYSCMHWSSHLCSDSDPASAEISALLDEFFIGPRLLYWIEVLSVMGKVPVAISALQQIKSCNKKLQGRHRELVDDVLRFLVAFSTPISTSTPQLYISGLPFMPAESSLWKNASKSFPRVINVCEGRMQSWPTLPCVWVGHASLVCCVSYSRDGRYVVSGSYDNTIRIWDAETGEAVGEPLKGHDGTVFSVTYSPDGRRVVSGSEDKTIRIWDAETGEAVGEPLRGHTDDIRSVAYSPDGRRVVSSSDDMTIRIWDAETGEAVGEPLRGHDGFILSVAYSPDGRRVVSGSVDRTIRIWDAETGEAVGEPLEGHEGGVLSIVYSPDGRRVVSGSDDKTIRIWDAETGEAVGEPLRGHTGDINSVAYSPDGQRVVSGSDDMTIRIWDAETGQAVSEPLRGHDGFILSVAYSPDGRRIVSGSSDKTIRIWDTETREAVGEPLNGHDGAVFSAVYSPDGRRVVSGSADRTIRTWDVETGVNSDGRRSVLDSSYLSSDLSDARNLVTTHRPSLAALSGAIPSDVLESNGYVRSTEGLLFWVPDDCRDGITCPAIMTIPNTGRHRSVRVDLSNFRYGTSWTKIYEGP